MKLPKNLSIDEVMQAVEESYSSCENPGFCLACGERQEGCEPDAEHYECEGCGAMMVFGAEQVILLCT